jgi:hypothetical protein
MSIASPVPFVGVSEKRKAARAFAVAALNFRESLNFYGTPLAVISEVMAVIEIELQARAATSVVVCCVSACSRVVIVTNCILMRCGDSES